MVTLFVAFYMIFQGNLYAKFYFIAGLFFTIFVGSNIFSNFSYFPRNTLTMYGFIVNFFVEVIFFSFALSIRLQKIKNEKVEIEKKSGEFREKLNSIQMEIETASRIHRTILPSDTPNIEGLDIYAVYIPSNTIGGDYYDFHQKDNKLGVFIADVTGHGTASAMVTAAISGYFVSVKSKLFAGENLDVDDILQGFDTVLSSMGHSDVSYNMTCFSCVFDFEKKVIRFANAGHNFPLLVKDDKKVETLIASGNRLGNIGATRIDNKLFEKKEVNCLPRDAEVVPFNFNKPIYYSEKTGQYYYCEK